MGNRWDDADPLTKRIREIRADGHERSSMQPLRSYDNARGLTDWTGCTYRQLDYWCRAGLLGDDLRNLGSGKHRTYLPGHYELTFALTGLASLGASKDHLEAAAAAIAARPVAPDGEVLVVYVDGPAQRFDKHACLAPATDPCWVVPLRPAPDLTTNENTPAGATARAS